jgi:hypothetical protein
MLATTLSPCFGLPLQGSHLMFLSVDAFPVEILPVSKRHSDVITARIGEGIIPNGNTLQDAKQPTPLDTSKSPASLGGESVVVC